MTEIAQLQRRLPIVDNEGKMERRYFDWARLVTQLQILRGPGSPEGNIEAGQATLYMDQTGASGNILWIKRDTDIAGDRSRGWILV